MRTSGDSDRAAAVATAARSALSRRFRNAVLAHTETLVDLGQPESGNPVAKPRDFERYHMAWLARQALTGIAPPKLLRDARPGETAVRGPAAGPCQPPSQVRLTALIRSQSPAARPMLLEWSLPALGLLMLWFVAAVLSADGDTAASLSLTIGVVALLASAGAVAGRRLRRDRQARSNRVDVRYTAVKYLRPSLSRSRQARDGVSVWSTTGNGPTSVMITVATTATAGSPVIGTAGAAKSAIADTRRINSSVYAAASIGGQEVSAWHADSVERFRHQHQLIAPRRRVGRAVARHTPPRRVSAFAVLAYEETEMPNRATARQINSITSASFITATALLARFI